ncbi:tetratricopeptide repeat-containing sulfotransferase family protein [Pseudomonas sp. CC6-YY-74]|uniref:tetratricopeptide repeat-containing sulfotransferase family protein n=1 Tax=Pseudomonas sp. CC6-YY-74 TaxID=1930532 RepID=UPI0009A2229B|nr:tetratricopeptide repeat-containing sulfotransferase family protein [Pseudomonas sp. CC6-YY-74]
MSYLNILRQLVDQQQFAALQSTAQNHWLETADVQALPLLVLAWAQLGQRHEAMHWLAEAEARLVQLDLDARVDLAAAYCLLQRPLDATTLLEGALEAQPDHPLALARLAWFRMHSGQAEVARCLYLRSAELAPQRLPVWSALARLCLEAGDPDAAQQALDAAIERLNVLHGEFPEPAVVQFTAQLRGLQLEIWLAQDDQARAEQWLNERRATLTEADWSSLLGGYAALLAGHDRHAAAEEALREAHKHYPENIGLLSQWAELAQVQGRPRQASQLLRRAIGLVGSQDAQALGLWLRLSAACLQEGGEQARQAADQALALAEALQSDETTPQPLIRQLRLQANNALAQVESQAQHFELAESLFREVLADNPWFVPALQGLGQQQMQRGKIDEALALFERIKQIDPAKGYAALISARQFPEDVQTLERMEMAARQPSLEGSLRSGLLLQLAAAWEKRKDYDKAFGLALEANTTSKKLLAYSAKAHRDHCARIRHAFNQALYEQRPQRGLDSTLAVYVVGMPRSGTTLVEQILAGHSQIFGAGELGVIPSRIQGLNRWERHTGSGRHYPDCVDDLSASVSAGIAQGILDELREYAPDAKHVVDKLPHNFENIGLIKFLLPKAKIISVRRDPRDIALSNYFTDYQAKHGGMGFAYDLTSIGEQLADHNLLMRHWHQLFPGEILEVNYEDVIEDLEGTARRMLDYIGVAWEPQVLAFNELERPIKTASVWQVRQPVYQTSKAKWRNYQAHLGPLIQGTNGKIEWEPIEMLGLPEPGLLNEGVELYKQGELDQAELRLKKLLQHVPEHAAANFMLGLVYMDKGHRADAIALMEKGQQKCPWNPNWRKDLIQAYEMVGAVDQADALQRKPRAEIAGSAAADGADWPAEFTETQAVAEGIST